MGQLRSAQKKPGVTWNASAYAHSWRCCPRQWAWWTPRGTFWNATRRRRRSGETEFYPDELAQLQAHQGWWPETGIPLAVEDWTIARALKTGETILNEEVEELVEGKHKVILHSAAPIRDAMGTIRGAVGVLQDITEHKRLERELAERAAQLGAILESIADGLIVTDAQGQLLYLNLAYRTLLGLAR